MGTLAKSSVLYIYVVQQFHYDSSKPGMPQDTIQSLPSIGNTIILHHMYHVVDSKEYILNMIAT